MGHLTQQLEKIAAAPNELMILSALGGIRGLDLADRDSEGNRKPLSATLGGLGGLGGAIVGTKGGEALVNSLNPDKVGHLDLKGARGKLVRFLSKHPKLASTLGVATWVATPTLGIDAGAYTGKGLARLLGD